MKTNCYINLRKYVVYGLPSQKAEIFSENGTKVGFVNKDEVFGEQSILLNTVRTVTAVASEESEAIKIPQKLYGKN